MRRVEKLYEILKSCELCPRKCRVDRTKGEKGICRSGLNPVISSVGPHFGEEPELVGRHGSGTIFFTYCNLGCIYCQNYNISHRGYGKEITVEELAKQMLFLQEIYCHNINLVTPTHFVPQIVKAIEIAKRQGLKIPIVYNCGGYENVEVIKLLEGIVDIYMPDIKYSDDEIAGKYSNASDYFERAKESIKEMHRQVGDLQVEDGIAVRGLIIRHLVLPDNLAGSQEILRFISEEISKDTYVNIMDQYRPMFKASSYPELNRRITSLEFSKVVDLARRFGLYRGF